MLMNEFCFVQLSTGGTSRRGEEVEQAKARSHAAAVTHKRRNLKRCVDKERAVLVNVNQPSTPRPDPLPFNFTRLDRCQFPARVTPAARDEEDLSEGCTNLHMNDPSYAERVHEQLDPFLKLAGHTTARERNLLHFCEGSR